MSENEVPAWPVPETDAPAPDWYVACFRNALRRVVCVLNRWSPFTACARIALSASDDAVGAAFERAGLDGQLIQFNIEGYDQFARSDEQLAENHFYANASFVRRGDRRVAVFKVPRAFLDWGYQKLDPPEADDLLPEDYPSGQDDPSYVRECATNYLVKNFWHNFVHGEIQGINQRNYGEFRGLAREDSDFEADHIANLLTLRSFGVELRYRGRGSVGRTSRVEAIFTRNRCNRVFVKRARHRHEDAAAASDDERWAEFEWRFCRGVANRVSTTLLAHHLAVPSLGIFLGGEARAATRDGTATRWRDGKVLAEVARRRFATPYPAYVPDDEWRTFKSGTPLPRERQPAIRRTRAKREQEIATWIEGEFKQLVLSSAPFRDSIGEQLEALGTRIAVDLV